MEIKAVALHGKHVLLEPVTEDHRDEMRQTLDRDPENWALQSISAIGEHFDAYWRLMTETSNRISVAVIDLATGRMAGTSSFFDIEPHHRTLEIGYTWFRPEYRGTAFNPETKLLMLAEAFEAGARRVQFSVSAANARSQAAVLKLGAKKEGVLRNHRITWAGHKRDTAIFSIIDEEWPDVLARLRARLAVFDSSANRAC